MGGGRSGCSAQTMKSTEVDQPNNEVDKCCMCSYIHVPRTAYIHFPIKHTYELCYES